MIKQIKIGITMGDPSGIGPEVIAKALTKAGINKLGKIFVIGDKWVFEAVAGRKIHSSNFEFINLNNVIHKGFAFGKIKAEFGKAAMEYLKTALLLLRQKKIDCLVTAPISKEAINMAGYNYNGHTEFLARSYKKQKEDVVMMLLNKYLKIGLVTRHIALSNVSYALNQGAICRAIIATHRALKGYFAIACPKICVAALNPHAGEGGLLGRDEIEVIVPAVKKVKQSIKGIYGPLPADTAFSYAKKGCFDAVVAMYHDQAIIPLKVLDFDSGVNLTLGLGFVRTSPLHGTGFDIAGKNASNSASLINAIKTAVKCTVNLRKKNSR
ncbi:MAG: 4-hydroxythreonine-4-phosphate dehydrogenase PdxA [Candidatus Omnitrophota bacterium]